MGPKGLLLIHALLQAADFGTTTAIMNRGGVEANPLMRSIVGNPLAFGAVKAVPVIGMSFMLGKTKAEKKQATKALKLINLLYAGVVANNLYQLSKN